MKYPEESPTSTQIEKGGFSDSIDHMQQTHEHFMSLLQSGWNMNEPEEEQLLSPATLMAQAANFMMIDARGASSEQLDERERTALEAAIRFHMLDSLAVGSTPESYELYDQTEDPAALIADVEQVLASNSVAVSGAFRLVSEYARYIAYDKEYNDKMFDKITFPERRELFKYAAIALSQPYFDKLQNLTNKGD